MAPPAPAFDTGCSHLAIATSDARVKLFGVASQRLAVDLTPALGAGAGGQSAEIFTALAWGSKGRVAIGTAAGAVRAADSASGSAAWSTTAPGITGGVAALAHAPDCDQLVVLGATGGAAVLDSATGSAVTHFKTQQETLSAALLLSGGRAVVAGLVTELVDVASGSRLARWAAHGAPVRALCAPASESCLVSAGEGERAAAVHSLAFGKKGKLVRKAACATIPLRAAAGALASADAEGAAPGEAAVVVAAALRDGGLEVFLAPASAPAKDAPAAQARRVAQAPAGAGVTAVAVRRASAKAATLLVATGSSARPVFQTVTLTFPKAGEEPAALQLEREAAGGALLGDEAVRAAGRQQKAGSATPVVVVGAETVVRAGVADAGRKRAAAEAEAEPTVAGLPDIVDPEEGGPTLGERVAALEGAAAAQPAPELPARPSAGSMASLLSQALRSDDRALLERCLSVRSERVIASTARAITGGDAVLLLRALVARLGASPLRGARLAAWTRATLRAHAASLAGAPGAAGTLGVLAQQIELRMAGYQQLLSLAGRLDLVLAQTGKGRRGAGAAGGDDSAPLRVEVDKDGAVAVEEVAAVNGLEEDLDASSSDDGLSSDGSGDEGDVPNGAAASGDEDDDVSASSEDEDMEE